MRALLCGLAATVLLAGCWTDRDDRNGPVVLPTPVSVGLTTAHRRFVATVHPRRVQFDPSNDDRLLVMESNGDVQIWTLIPSAARPGGAQSLPLIGELAVTIPAEAIDARFSADGAAIFTAGAEGAVSLWRADGQLLWSRRTDGDSVRAVATSGDLLAAGSDRGDILIWRHDSSLAHRRPLAHEGPILSMAFSAGGDMLVSEGFDTLLRGWKVPDDDAVLLELASYRPASEQYAAMLPSLVRLDVQWGWDRSVVFVPGKDLLAACGFGGLLQLWHPTGELVAERGDAHGYHHLRSIAASPDGSLIATGGFNTEVRLWSPTDLADPKILKGHYRVVTGVAFDRHGRVASASLDGTVRLWSTSGEPLGWLPHKDPPRMRRGAAAIPDSGIIERGR